MNEPNIEQKRIMENNGLKPENWLVVFENKNSLEVVSRHTFQRRKLSKDKIKDKPLTLKEIREIEKRNAEDRCDKRESVLLVGCKKKCLKCGNAHPIGTELRYCNICGGFLYIQQEIIVPQIYQPKEKYDTRQKARNRV